MAAHHQSPVFVAERDRKPIDLGFQDETQVRGFSPSLGTELRRTGIPSPEFLFVLGVGQRQHRLKMTYLRESGQRLAPDALGGRIGSDQFRMGTFQLLELAKEGIVVRVGYLGAVQDVVAVLMVTYDVAQLLQPARYLWIGICHDAPPSRDPRTSERTPGTVCTRISGFSAARTSSENTPHVTPMECTPAANAAWISEGLSPT